MSKSIVAIQIDKNVPLPTTRHSGAGAFSTAVSAALAEMQAGDSFVYTDSSKSQSLAATVRGVAKKTAIKIAIRKISDSEHRVWRVE